MASVNMKKILKGKKEQMIECRYENLTQVKETEIITCYSSELSDGLFFQSPVSFLVSSHLVGCWKLLVCLFLILFSFPLFSLCVCVCVCACILACVCAHVFSFSREVVTENGTCIPFSLSMDNLSCFCHLTTFAKIHLEVCA